MGVGWRLSDRGADGCWSNHNELDTGWRCLHCDVVRRFYPAELDDVHPSTACVPSVLGPARIATRAILGKCDTREQLRSGGDFLRPDGDEGRFESDRKHQWCDA